MQKTKIEWTDYTWNPIKGFCPNDCWYCYARKIYERFGWDTEMKIAEEYPEIITMQMYDNKRRQISRKVFVCSTFELFHPEVPKLWRDWIFDNIKYNYHLTFQILTKFPQNIDREMPPNVWLGVTVDQDKAFKFDEIHPFWNNKAKIKFVSFEPLLERIPFTWLTKYGFDWIILGRLTGFGKKHDPKREWIKELVDRAKQINKPIFLKDNLQEIWGGPLIQEFP